MTQVQLRLRLGLKSSGAVPNWETGRNSPTADRLATIAKVLGVDLAAIVAPRRR